MNAITVLQNCDTMKNEKLRYIQELFECAQYAAWEKSQMFLNTMQNFKESYIVIDDVQYANRVFVNGMYSNICPASTRWFTYIPAKTLKKQYVSESLRRYMAEATTVLYELLMNSNFTSQMLEGLELYGATGLINLYIEEDWEKTFKFLSIHPSEYLVRTDSFGYVLAVYRESQMTARQIIEEYIKNGDKVPQEIREAGESELAAQYEKKFTIIKAIEPNKEVKYDYTGRPFPGNKNKAFKSYHVCRETKSLIRESGYDEMPFAVTSFIKDSKTFYGRGPAAMCLRTAKILNKVDLTSMKAEERDADPVTLLDIAAYDATKGLSPQFYNNPGEVNLYNSKKGNPPQYLTSQSRLDGAERRKERLIQTINSNFFVDIFQMAQKLNMEQGRQRTAYEWMRLTEEKNQMVIPVTANLLQNFFSPLLKRCFWIAFRMGRLPQPPAEVLEMDNFQIEFTSPLALAAQMTEINSVFQSVEMLDPLSKYDPNIIRDVLKLNEVSIGLFEKRGVNPKYYRTAGEIEERQTQRAQQEAEKEKQMAAMELAKGQDLNRRPDDGSAIGALVNG